MASRRRQKDKRKANRPKTAEERMRVIARMLVAFGRQSGQGDDVIKRQVTAAIKEALEGGPVREETVTIDGKPEVALDGAGCFRLIICNEDIDRHDQRAQEKWFSVVMDELRRELAAG